MKKLIFLSFCFLSINLSAQDQLNEIVSKGIKLHDAGQYDEAIETYKEALVIDKNSTLVHYEIGYSYLAKQDLKKAIKHLDIVIKQDKDYLKEAFAAKGSALDNLGKSKEAVKVYNKAIKKYPEDYLLHFNLGITNYRRGEKKMAEENFISTIQLNPSHATSNYLLGIIKAEENRRVESLLSLYFFLLLEPDSKRSQDAFAIMKNLLSQGIERKGEKDIQINIGSLGTNDDFSSIDLMISMLGASNSLEENKNKTEQEIFYENTEKLFSMMSELKEGKKGFWWDFYIDFYSGLLESKNIEAFCYYISQSNGIEEQEWLKKNEDKLNKFGDWLNK